MLGYSVYLNQQIDEQLERMTRYRDHGFRRIFTSLHIPEENSATYRERLNELGLWAKKNKMHVTADVAADSLDALCLSLNNVSQLKDMGINALRLDDGFDEKSAVALSNQIAIVLNASTLTPQSLAVMLREGMVASQVTACHNFYPRPETGLSRQAFRRANAWFKEAGLSVAAFFPGDQNCRGPLYKGLPTLEDHRHYSPFAAFVDLLHESVDDLILGDPDMSDQVLEQFIAWDKGVILLHAHPETQDKKLLKTLSTVQTNRPDEARDCVRSYESRMLHLVDTPILPDHHHRPRPMGSITIDNECYGRYQGEIQISKRDLAADEKVNRVGRIISKDLPLLQYISGSTKFQIIWESKRTNK